MGGAVGVLGWQSRYFKPEELLSPDGLELAKRGVIPIHAPTVTFLDGFREYVDIPLYVNHDGLRLRGFRSPEEHLSLVAKGTTKNKFSFHCQGVAFDLSSKAIKPKELGLLAKTYGWRGVIVYGNWIHVDMRSYTTHYEGV